jgi:hypothetical protein
MQPGRNMAGIAPPVQLVARELVDKARTSVARLFSINPSGGDVERNAGSSA